MNIYSNIYKSCKLYIISIQPFHLNLEQVKSGPTGRSSLDREKQDHFELRVLATDTPSGGSEQKSSATKVCLKIFLFCILIKHDS